MSSPVDLSTSSISSESPREELETTVWQVKNYRVELYDDQIGLTFMDQPTKLFPISSFALNYGDGYICRLQRYCQLTQETVQDVLCTVKDVGFSCSGNRTPPRPILYTYEVDWKETGD